MPELIAGDRAAGRFGAVQLVAAELAVIAGGGATVIAAAAPPVSAGLAGAAALLVGTTLGRSGGRWIYEAAEAKLRHIGRKSPRASGLAALVPDLTITGYTDRGTAIGIGQDSLGWFAAVVIALPDDRLAMRVDWLAQLLTDFTVPVSTLQLVTRQVPLSNPVDEATPCAMSYRELLGMAPMPANREVCVAVRLGPEDAARAAYGRGGGVTGVHKAMAAVIARISTALVTAGLNHHVLDANGLKRVLNIHCGLFQEGPVADRWSGWHAAGFVHVAYAVRGWPGTPSPRLLTELAQVPTAAAIHTAVVLRPNGSHNNAVAPRLRVLLRLAATPDRIAQATRQLHDAARLRKAKLTRLNGEHAAAVYATAPTGSVHGVALW